MSRLGNITLIGDFDENMCQVLRKVVMELQKRYDLDSSLIEGWLNSEGFEESLIKLDKMCFEEVMKREHPDLSRLLAVSHAESFIDEGLPWEREKCGQILEECSNGYIKYCNQHKYLHLQKGQVIPDEGEGELGEEGEKVLDHYFVQKTSKEILEEQIFKLKFNLYVDYTRRLAEILQENFLVTLKQGREEGLVNVDSEGENLIEWLREHPEDFRERFPTDRNGDIFVKVYLKSGEVEDRVGAGETERGFELITV